MKETQLIRLEQTNITTWDFPSIKEELSKALSIYKNTIYTDDKIKLAKEDRANLGKLKELVEEKRKKYKAKCMEPYEELAPKIKELVDMIEEQRGAIDKVVKDFAEKQKAEKEEEIRAFYLNNSHILGELAEPLFQKILDPKWLNASAGKKYQAEIKEKVCNAAADVRIIKALKSPFVDTLIEKYVATLSVEDAIAKHDELVAAACKAGFGQKTDQQPTYKLASIGETVGPENGTLVLMHGTEDQIARVLDFAKSIGVIAELQ